jgi:hypothetical protein
MGYSCTARADDTYRMWVEICKDTTGMGNVYLHNGNKYCLEIGREQRDGAITGTVLRLEPNGTNENGREQHLAYSNGTFRIDSDGTVKRYPTGLKKLTEKRH